MTGGAEVFAVNAAKALAPSHDVYLWTQRSGDYTIQGTIPIYDVDPVMLAKALACDLVVFNNGCGLRLADRFHAETNAKTVLCLHGLVKWTADQFRGLRELIGRVDAIWAFSSVLGGMRVLGYNRPSYQLHCPVDGQGFPFVRRAWRAPYRIGYIGRVSVEKNLCALVGLWHRIWLLMGDRVRFDFIGGLDPSNHDAAYLRWLGPVIAKAKALPEWGELIQAGAIVDHGHCERARVRGLIRGMHLVTLTSDFEGEPVVFTEAMASGAICSFRALGEVDEQLSGCGLLTVPQARKLEDSELQAMASGIVDLLRDPARCRRLALAGRARYESTHAFPAWAENFDRMMGDILR